MTLYIEEEANSLCIEFCVDTGDSRGGREDFFASGKYCSNKSFLYFIDKSGFIEYLNLNLDFRK